MNKSNYSWKCEPKLAKIVFNLNESNELMWQNRGSRKSPE